MPTCTWACPLREIRCLLGLCHMVLSPCFPLAPGRNPWVPVAIIYWVCGLCSFSPKPWSHSFQETLLWSLDGFTLLLMKASDVPTAWLSLWVCLQERDWPTLFGLGHTTGRGWGMVAQFYSAAQLQPGRDEPVSFQHKDRQEVCWLLCWFLFLPLSIT